MHERPDGVSDHELLTVVRDGWSAEVGDVEHLAVGFGAHHWRATAAGWPRLFVTLDPVEPRHTPQTLERSYAAAALLASRGLEFVLPSVVTAAGSYTVPLQAGRVSCADWVDGVVVGTGAHVTRSDAERTAALLERLHRTDVLPALRRWTPLVGADFAATLSTRLDAAWDTGPYGERVRSALQGHLSQITVWVEKYHHRASLTSDENWVVTHGEPHTANQMTTASGLVLVDWESIMVAPRERDLRVIVDSGFGDLVDADPTMIEMFDLGWRLDEISAYARWFAAPHPGNASDAEAYAGLMEELTRP